MRKVKSIATVALAVVLGCGLAACVQRAPVAAPTLAQPTLAPTPEPSLTVAAPIIRPGESAAANKPFFDLVNSALNTASGMSDGRTIVDTLVAAGFRKQDMQVTADRTAIDLAVDSIVVSVRVKGQCLIGQFTVSGYHSTVGPILAQGRCLVGTSRPIDW